MNLPPLLDNLYRDLRDKRLLPVVGLLLVALVVVPIALGGEDAPDPSGAAAPSAALGSVEEAPEVDTVVLAEIPGIRNYKQRLDEFKRRNPFKQQLTQPSADARKQLEAAKTEAASVASGSGGAGSKAGGSGGSGGGNTSGGSGGGSEIIIFSYRINAKMGPIGDSKAYEGVKLGDFLPGKKRPIVQLLAASEEDDTAIFYVSRSVSLAEGDGSCFPSKRDCEFLRMRVGDQQRLEYEPEGRAYRLKLSKIELVEERRDRKEFSTGALDESQGVYGALQERIASK